MKKLVIIMILLILTAFALLAIENVKADSSEVNVGSYSQYVAPSTSTLASAPGDLIVVGELRNIGANIIGNVTVQGTAFSSNGYILAVTSSQAFSYCMLPSQKAPFYLDFNAQSSSTKDLSWVPHVDHVLVTTTSVEEVNLGQYADVKVVYDMNYTDNSGLYVVRGTVANTGSLVDEQPWVVTTFYDASGTVVGLNFTDYLATTLAPNGGVLFFATPADNNTQITNKIKSYLFQVDSLTLTTSSPTSTSSMEPTLLATPTPTYATTPTPTQTSTITPTSTENPNHQNSSATFPIEIVYAITAIIITLIIAITIVILKKSSK